MNTLVAKDFEAGWVPSSDPVRGEEPIAYLKQKNGLLRMDNVQLDQYAALTLTRGAFKVNTFQFDSVIHSIYSKILAGTKYRYVGLLSGKVIRDAGAGTFPLALITSAGGGAFQKTAFGSTFNYALIISGEQKVKDSGAVQYRLGVKKPTAPVAVVGSGNISIALGGSYALTALEGTTSASGASYFTGVLDPATFRYSGYLNYSSSLDTTDYFGIQVGLDSDLFEFDVRITDTSLLVSIQLVFYFATPSPGDTVPDFINYYSFEWDTSDPNVRIGANSWSRLSAQRKDFTRAGTDNTKGWKNVFGYQFIVTFSNTIDDFSISSINVIGSSGGPLTGKYEYLQVNVGNNGYFAKSSPGPAMDFYQELNNGFAIVTPQDPNVLSDFQINEVWIYRRKIDAPGGDPSGNFFRIAQITTALGSAFHDGVTDQQAQTIDEPLNPFLISLQDSSFPDDVMFMECNYFERTLYMTPREIWLSDPLCPDAVDTRFTINLSGDAAEINLWMIKAGPALILVGTTNDIYEISGTLREQPDGTLDINVIPLGIKQPPTTSGVCIYKNTVYYFGTDGLNKLTGAINESFNGSLSALWDGYTVHGLLPFSKDKSNINSFHLAASKNKLFMQVVHSDNSRSICVYSFKYNYWYHYTLDPVSLYVEEDDILLAGFANAGDFYLRVIDSGITKDGGGQAMLLRTLVMDDNQPLVRKDSYVLKLKIDTGGLNCTVKIYKNESTTGISLATFATSGIQEVAIDISSSIGLAKSYQLELSGVLTSFRMTEWSIEYDPRPKQTLYLRIPPNNYNTPGRKRYPTLPLLIDTLGANVTFTPTIDGVDQSPTTINTADKQVFNYLFTSDKTGYSIGGKLSAPQYFEFYELIQPRVVEILPDSTQFFIIPPSSLGTQTRKRIVAIAIVIDTRGLNVTFTPIIDGNVQATSTVNTTGKSTYIHYFTSEVIGTDISGQLSSAIGYFEFYGIDENECISEKMPIPTKFLVIPQDDYGTPNRKRFSSFKFVINTRGQSVTFSPRIDGANYLNASYITTEKRTVEYFFAADTIGIDIGGTLSSNGPFEYYGALKPQTIEQLPDRLTYFVIPENNFGLPAKKRVRTLPLIINTNGSNVTFTPIVDNFQAPPPSIFNTPNKQTVLHYFQSDVFGIDFKGILSGPSPFEFYGMLQPVDVQQLPVGKKLDQIGPIETPKLGKLLSFRLRLIAEGTSISYRIFSEDISVFAGIITTEVLNDKIYEVRLQKGVTVKNLRMELSSSSVFHRFYARFQINYSGMETEAKWMMFGADPDQKLK